ncbi:MAG: 8-oxo-dGTP diphosphatase [Clostridia bacterium]|nr:8-oxo-dGTP diphosphatase [Clostridia bacterium]
MRNTTLCYIENGNSYLMLHRIKKKNDENQGKYVGIGGHFLENESPYECVVREAKEETGLDIVPIYRGIVTFVSDKYECEQMHLFTCKQYSGNQIVCNEGTLEWIEKSDLNKIPMWQGDYIFFDLLEKRSDFFSLKLEYQGDTLVSYSIDGVNIK